MPTYIITTRAEVLKSYRVSAENVECAKDAVLCDEADARDESTENEYIVEVYEDRDGVLVETD